MRPLFGILLLPVVATLLEGAHASAQHADTIYYGGPIITVNDQQPMAEAVGVRDGKILAVGDETDVLKHKSDATKLVALRGRTMLPGFDPAGDLRPVLIHGQTMREDQVDAPKQLDIFPSLFPMHTFYWQRRYLTSKVTRLVNRRGTPWFDKSW